MRALHLFHFITINRSDLKSFTEHFSEVIFNVNPTDWRKHHGVQSSDPTFKDPPQLISPPGSTRLRKPLDGVPSRQLRIHPPTNPPEFSDEQTHKNTHTDIQLWKNMHSVCSQLGLHGEMERLKMNGWTERGKKSQRCRVKSEGCPISLSLSLRAAVVILEHIPDFWHKSN